MSGRGQESHDDDNDLEMVAADDDSGDESVTIPGFVKVRHHAASSITLQLRVPAAASRLHLFYHRTVPFPAESRV